MVDVADLTYIIRSLKLRNLLRAALPVLLLSCSKPKPLVYRDIKNVRVHNMDFRQATIVLDLQFYNPNGYGLSLKNGDLDAYISDKYIGKATLDERTMIPARDTFVLPVSVTANLGSLLNNAISIITHAEQNLPVRLQGTVRAGKGGVFFPVKVNYSGMQKIRL